MVIVRKSEVLSSPGDLTTEIRLFDNANNLLLFESCPIGFTTGQKEVQLHKEKDKLFEEIMSSVDFDACDTEHFDSHIKEHFGSRITTPLSLCFLRYKALKENKDLTSFLFEKYHQTPKDTGLIVNILNGGKHAGNNLSFCEFMIIPKTKTLKEKILTARDIYLTLGAILNTRGESTNVGREGGFAPRLKSTREALSVIQDAISVKNAKLCVIGIDVAATNFCRNDNGVYKYTVDGIEMDTKELLEFYDSLLNDYPSLSYLEDPFHENDLDGWLSLTTKYGDKIMIVADDLTVSSKDGMNNKLGLFNSVILKPNQIGTFTDMTDAFFFAGKKGIKTIVSHRSGETDTPTISDIGVGLGADFLKIGAPARERIIKYNNLLRRADLQNSDVASDWPNKYNSDNQQKNAQKEFDTATRFLQDLLSKHTELKLIIRGSNTFTSDKILYWSDIDASIITPAANSTVLRKCSNIYKQFKDAYPHIKLSLTVVNQNDKISLNPLHHHGIKPISYNYELVTQVTDEGYDAIKYDLDTNVIRISSIYRYYEILYTFRKEFLKHTQEHSFETICEWFHRLARFIRTQIEILKPDLIKKHAKILERQHSHLLNNQEIIANFFTKYDSVRQNWPELKNDATSLTQLADYLADTFDKLHESFLHQLKLISKEYIR